jgi:hypothetical protein
MSGFPESGQGWAIYEYASLVPESGSLAALSQKPARRMPRPLRRRPKPDRRSALELLASCRDGCTEAIMIAHGFTLAQMVKLVRAEPI